MAIYTKGPWLYAKNGRTYYIDAQIKGGALQEVAACGLTENREEQGANARLISAAPELLEALQDLLRETGVNGAFADKAIAAINKATGGEDS